MANVIYTPKDVLQKEFKTKKIGGYDPIEVDEFLDNVIKDYEAYNRELVSLQEENNRLLAKLDQASKTQSLPRSSHDVPKSAAVTNFDILKRLSNLEREVFGKKLDDPSSASRVGSSSFSRESDLSQTRQF